MDSAHVGQVVTTVGGVKLHQVDVRSATGGCSRSPTRQQCAHGSGALHLKKQCKKPMPLPPPPYSSASTSWGNNSCLSFSSPLYQQNVRDWSVPGSLGCLLPSEEADIKPQNICLPPVALWSKKTSTLAVSAGRSGTLPSMTRCQSRYVIVPFSQILHSVPCRI